MKRIDCIAAGLALFASVSIPQVACGAEPLPREAQAAVDESIKACSEKTRLEPGFVTRPDINGDGVADVILAYGHFVCGDNASYFCGSAGCLTTVFASLPGGKFVKVWDENVEGIAFRRVKDRPAMLLELHGSDCGRAGADRCHETRFWNGRGFKAK